MPSDCRIRCVKVLEGGFLSPALEEGSTEDGKPVFPPQLCKTEPTFTKDIETFLASFTSPLQIVHTVDRRSHTKPKSLGSTHQEGTRSR